MAARHRESPSVTKEIPEKVYDITCVLWHN